MHEQKPRPTTELCDQITSEIDTALNANQIAMTALQAEMTERLYKLRQVEGKQDPITEFRRERDLNEAIDQYSDLLRMMGSAAILGPVETEHEA